MPLKTVHGSSLLTRRQFGSALLGSAAVMAAYDVPFLAAGQTGASGGPWRAAIIGATGHGDYGHDLDVIFNDRSDVQVVAVADPDSAGRAKAAARSKAVRQYADYQEMLVKEKPQLVCLAPRWSDQRSAMGFAALRAGAHLYTEKPFTTSLAEADELIAEANRAGLKIAVAHQMRLAPSTLHLKQAIAGGLIGDLLEIRAWGKQDDRAGGEDMIVLGSHLFDLIRFFAGDALSCTARVLHQGRDLVRQDARRVKEQIGLVGGDEIQAQFAFARGVNVTFTSRKRLRQTAGPWGLEFVGSKATARMLTEIYPSLYVLKPGAWELAGKADSWQRLETDPGMGLSADERGFRLGNRRVVDDWLGAIRENREPVCSGHAAMQSLELIMAVYHAALTGVRVPLPLVDRAHPLGG